MRSAQSNLSQSARKRRRPAYSCTECRRRKVRCDRTKPSCGQCRALELTASCMYEENHRTRPRSRAESRAPRSDQHDSRPQSSPELPHIHTPSTPLRRFEGTVSKTRIFGHGHWMNTFSLMEGLSPLQPFSECYEAFSRNADDSHSRDDVAEMALECKRLAQGIKKQRPSRRCLPAEIYRFFPDRVVMDELVQLYFTTFESCYGILYHLSFMEEYTRCMEYPEGAESSFLLQLLLIMTVAGALHADASVRSEMGANARIWIDIAQNWLSAPLEKDRLTLKAIQVHCLLLLSRQVNQVGADLVWISAGSLMRIAMQMGLHQDPNLLGRMSFQAREIRRRLWYTILEMNVQAAIDSGMAPMITDEDYNAQPPSSFSELHKDGTEGPEDADTTLTADKCSFQSLLAKSIPLRLRATRLINSMQEEPSYDQVLEVGNELTLACCEATVIINQSPSTSHFAASFCSHLLRRFPLCLHYRYAIKAKANPLYSHSRQMCQEATLDLLTLLEDNLYGQVLRVGGGMFRDLITRGAIIIFLELSLDPQAETSIFASKRNRAHHESLLQDVRRLVQYAKDRISNGDMNVKAYVFLSMMMAHTEARLDGLPIKEAITGAMRSSLDICRSTLEAVAATSTPDIRHADLDFWTNGMMSAPHLDTNFDSDLDALFNFDFTESQLSLQGPGQMLFG